MAMSIGHIPGRCQSGCKPFVLSRNWRHPKPRNRSSTGEALEPDTDENER